MFKKLRNSMLIFNMITLTFVILAAFSLVFVMTAINLERSDERRLLTIPSIGFTPAIRNAPQQIEERFAIGNQASFFILVKDGRIEHVDGYVELDESVYAEALEKVGGQMKGRVTFAGREWMFAVTQRMVRTYSTPITADMPSAHIAFLDVSNSVEVLRGLFFTLLFIGIFVTLVLFFISYRFSVRAVRPIEEGYNKQKRFVADASHELRTPLAIIGANIAAIETNGDESVESQREWFGYIRSELARTGKLVDDLLYLAKAEDAGLTAGLPVDLSVICVTACASMEAVLYDGGISLGTAVEENILVTGDEEKLKQVLYILLDNAGKYTPHGGHIDVSLCSEQDRAVLVVANTGSEIAADELPKIFDRFYRPDTSRTQETGGFGLGLSIAKTIVERSGGEISVNSSEEHTIFTVKLKNY